MAGKFGHQNAPLTDEQIEYGAAAFFVKHVSGCCWQSFRAMQRARAAFYFDFFLYRFVSFVHLICRKNKRTFSEGKAQNRL
jgi:hypothetical protein